MDCSFRPPSIRQSVFNCISPKDDEPIILWVFYVAVRVEYGCSIASNTNSPSHRSKIISRSSRENCALNSFARFSFPSAFSNMSFKSRASLRRLVIHIYCVPTYRNSSKNSSFIKIECLILPTPYRIWYLSALIHFSAYCSSHKSSRYAQVPHIPFRFTQNGIG